MWKRLGRYGLFLSALGQGVVFARSAPAQVFEPAQHTENARSAAVPDRSRPELPYPGTMGDPAPVLKAEYKIRLTSAWPVLVGESGECNNLGHEVLEGTLTRLDARYYTGRFTRTSQLGFCGSHGPAQPQACGLKLTGSGKVEMEARAYDEGRGIEMHTLWKPIPELTEVKVVGTCSEGFESALQSMYLDVSHRIDIPLNPNVVGKGSVHLEDYGWLVEIE